MRKPLAIAALAIPFILAPSAWASPAAPATSGSLAKWGDTARFTYPPTYYPHERRKRDAILALRDEGLKMQAADGGKLTENHRAYLQAKLDAVLHGNY